MTDVDVLPSWNDTGTRRAIVGFVDSVTREDGPGYVSPEERVAVFDNDGTLWCEKPMPIQLVLEANGFTTYIASGGDRDFMRPATMELYGVPRERVIGSSFALEYREDDLGGSVMYKAQLDFMDDGPEKPVRIWSRIGRRPILAAGNSNGDAQMLQFAGGGPHPALRLLLLHDDAGREFDYTAGAEDSLERARAQGWTVISIKDDWAKVFDDADAATFQGAQEDP